jgi:hypothetical protein
MIRMIRMCIVESSIRKGPFSFCMVFAMLFLIFMRSHTVNLDHCIHSKPVHVKNIYTCSRLI